MASLQDQINQLSDFPVKDLIQAEKNFEMKHSDPVDRDAYYVLQEALHLARVRERLIKARVT